MSTLADQLRRMGFSDDQIAKATVGGKRLAEAEKARKSQDAMNKTESLYTIELDWQKREGKIERWAFQALKFRLADRTWFTPDFIVWLEGGRLRIVEIKGGYVREDSAVKFKVARDLYPEFEWVCLQRTKAGWRELFIS